ncbi:hypothetical protein BSU04_33195 [Caballeronia sordidicola]|uniref:Uncharacterized protein n=1 Tax=Caballeronia sordidicola TaxID=196367 RepID=A0A226WTP3_CABSO|nr:hypothetical protein BSU04_33195 [Caballeronia sordidicola]
MVSESPDLHFEMQVENFLFRQQSSVLRARPSWFQSIRF